MEDKKAKATSKIANRLSTIKKYFSRQGDLSDLSDIASFAYDVNRSGRSVILLLKIRTAKDRKGLRKETQR